MNAAALTIVASLLFATMAVGIKYASQYYSSGEIVMYRGLVGAAMIALVTRWRGESLRTTVLRQHVERSSIAVIALMLWFQAIAALPLATAVTLNYTSSVWLAVILMVSAHRRGGPRIEHRLLSAVAIGFIGVLLVLRPTIAADAFWYGVLGLTSGLLAAVGYLQVAALGRAGEPETRMVFYFSLAGAVGGAAMSAAGGGWSVPQWPGIGWLLAVGVLSTIAQLLLTRAYARGSTLTTASLQYLGIAFSFSYGVLLFGDAINGLAIFGIVLIVGAGIRAAQMRPPTTSEKGSHARFDPDG